MFFFIGQSFKVDNKEIVPFYDPPHLMKGIENNLLTKDFLMQLPHSFPALFGYYKKCVDRKLNTIRSQLQKLTRRHKIEKKMKKMRVKYVTWISSGTAASKNVVATRWKCKYSHDVGKNKIGIVKNYITCTWIAFLLMRWFIWFGEWTGSKWW